MVIGLATNLPCYRAKWARIASCLVALSYCYQSVEEGVKLILVANRKW
jgi:hypothetical protein